MKSGLPGRVLLSSPAASAAYHAGIALALDARSLPPLMIACLLAGLPEANIAIAQSAIALAGGSLAAISMALPLPAMGALALVGSGLLMRPGAEAATAAAS